MNFDQGNHISKNSIKSRLIKKLMKEHAFWSFDKAKMKEIPDEVIIEKTLIHLDLDEINALFEIFPYQKIKSVWKKRMLPQNDRYKNLNYFFENCYFNR